MKQILLTLGLFATLSTQSFAYESYLNTSDSGGFKVYAGGINNATIKNINGRTIELKGKGIKSGYILGSVNGSNAWKNTEDRVLKIWMKNSDIFTFYVPIKTLHGYRYLTYTNHPNHINKRGIEGAFIYIGLEKEELTVGKRRLIERNLSKDLKKYDSDNKILVVNALMIRGNTEIDVITLESEEIVTPVNGTTYEDGTNADKWRVYAGGKQNATIKTYNYLSRYMESSIDVTALKGNGIKSGYILGGVSGSNAWHNTSQKVINFDMIKDEKNIFTVYIPIKTTNGYRYLTYTTHPNHSSKRGKEGSLIYIAIEQKESLTSREFSINLERDLNRYEPNNKLLEVNGIMVRGDCYIKTVRLTKAPTLIKRDFDVEKFSQLLQIEKAKLEKESSNGIIIHHPKGEKVNNFAWSSEGAGEFDRVYTLDKTGTKLEVLYSRLWASRGSNVEVTFKNNNNTMAIYDNYDGGETFGIVYKIYDISMESNPSVVERGHIEQGDN